MPMKSVRIHLCAPLITASLPSCLVAENRKGPTLTVSLLPLSPTPSLQAMANCVTYTSLCAPRGGVWAPPLGGVMRHEPKIVPGGLSKFSATESCDGNTKVLENKLQGLGDFFM